MKNEHVNREEEQGREAAVERLAVEVRRGVLAAYDAEARESALLIASHLANRVQAALSAYPPPDQGGEKAVELVKRLRKQADELDPPRRLPGPVPFITEVATAENYRQAAARIEELESRQGGEISDEEAVRKLRDAWFAGFGQSGEGYNAEYPFDGDFVDDEDLKREATAHAESTSLRAASPHLNTQQGDRDGLREAAQGVLDAWLKGEPIADALRPLVAALDSSQHLPGGDHGEAGS